MVFLTAYKMFMIRKQETGTFLNVIMRDGVWAFVLVLCA